MLFTIYNLEGKEVMSLKIGRKVKFSYLGVNTKGKQKIMFNNKLADGR